MEESPEVTAFFYDLITRMVKNNHSGGYAQMQVHSGEDARRLHAFLFFDAAGDGAARVLTPCCSWLRDPPPSEEGDKPCPA